MASGERPGLRLACRTSLLILLEAEKAKGGTGQTVQQPEISCWFRGSSRKKPGPPWGHTAVRSSNERGSRKALDRGLLQVLWLREGLNSCLQAGVLRGCETRKAGWEVPHHWGGTRAQAPWSG